MLCKRAARCVAISRRRLCAFALLRKLLRALGRLAEALKTSVYAFISSSEGCGGSFWLVVRGWAWTWDACGVSGSVWARKHWLLLEIQQGVQ